VALQAVDGKRVKAGVDLDVDELRADAQIAAFVARQRARHKITLDIDVDEHRLGLVTSGLAATFANIGSRLGSTVFGGLAAEVGRAKDNFEQLAESTGKTLGIAGQLTGVLLQVGGASLLIATAGAAITAAWGAVATTIAAVPAAVFAIGAPIATVFLGLDGIKKAAEALKPSFENLKKSVSATFEQGLTPIFTKLATLFPQVEGSVNNVATALVGIAGKLTNFITSSAGVALVNTIFNLSAQALQKMSTGLDDIVQGILRVAAQSGAFDAITGAVNTFGAAFKASVLTLINDKTLGVAFDGLRGTLEALSRAFVGLVENGIRTFAAAAPGLNHVIDSITGFFSRFDWNSLGTSVSRVFDGLGSAIDGIDPGTVDAITTAFSGWLTCSPIRVFSSTSRGSPTRCLESSTRSATSAATSSLRWTPSARPSRCSTPSTRSSATSPRRWTASVRRSPRR
jgi:hypothetical protein